MMNRQQAGQANVNAIVCEDDNKMQPYDFYQPEQNSS